MILPLLPSRNAVLLPGAVSELLVGRPAAVTALRAAEPDVLVLLQKKADADDPGPDDFHGLGSIATPVDATRVDAESASVALRAHGRARVIAIRREGPGLYAEVEPLPWAPAVPALAPEVGSFLEALVEVAVAEELSARAQAALVCPGPAERLCAVGLAVLSPPEELQAALETADLAPLAKRVADIQVGGALGRIARWFRGG